MDSWTIDPCYSNSSSVGVCVCLRDKSMRMQSFSRLWQTSVRPPWIIIALHYFRFNLMISNGIPAAQTCLKRNSQSAHGRHIALCAWACLCGRWESFYSARVSEFLVLQSLPYLKYSNQIITTCGVFNEKKAFTPVSGIINWQETSKVFYWIELSAQNIL